MYGGAWNGECFVMIVSTNPYDSKYANLYQGRTTGSIAACALGPFDGSHLQTWYVPDPEESLIASMAEAARLVVEAEITAPEIGIGPQAMGYVGVPIWFYAKNPGPGIASPQTRKTTVDGHTLRMTIRFSHMTIETSDGATTTCRRLGTKPPEHRLASLPSPSGCDHVFTKRGDYTITVITTVVADWTGAGQTGVITATVERTATYHIGEIQVVNTLPEQPR
jgi:hypothetical protein